MSSSFCDNCAKIIYNQLNYYLGIEKNDSTLIKTCNRSKYPKRSCREIFAQNILQSEYVRYLENEVADKQRDDTSA